MAIIKLDRINNPYQVKLRGPDGKWITKTFSRAKDAEEFETQLKGQKQEGSLISNSERQITVEEYFNTWMETIQQQASPGWRSVQKQLFRDYISPLIGKCKLQNISSPIISKILNEMAGKGKSEQTRLHAFNLLRKMFLDAVELFQILTFNPVIKKLKPRVPLKETRHLNIEQIRALLNYVKDKPYGVAVWLQLYLGLRVGEVQALSWTDIDLETGIVFLKKTFSRKDSWVTKEVVIKDFPKGRKQHNLSVPPELKDFLLEKKKYTISTLVSPSPQGKLMSYERYRRVLVKFCTEAKVPVIGTHGLRHSTSTVYMNYGATKDDLRILFAHSSPSLTDRYTHGLGANLQKVSNVIRLFSEEKCSTLGTFQK